MTITLEGKEAAEYLEYLQSKKDNDIRVAAMNKKPLPFTTADRDIDRARGIVGSKMVPVERPQPITTKVPDDYFSTMTRTGTAWTELELAILKERIFKVGMHDAKARHLDTIVKLFPGRSLDAIRAKVIKLGGKMKNGVVSPRIVK